MDTVLVTGATGTVGSRVVAQLEDAAVRVRAAVRDTATATVPEGVETVPFDFERPETWGRALEGVTSMFLVRPPELGHRTVTPVVDAAARMGVEHVVFLSVLGAAKNPLLPHRRIERHLERSALAATFLRASFFTQNFETVHKDELIEDGEIVVPAGDGTTSFIDAEDIAAVAAVALTEPGHHHRAYDLTGPAALTYHEVAAVFDDVLERPVRYTNPSIPEFVRHSRAAGHKWPFILVMVGVYTTARLGLAGRVTDDVERVLGRPPRSFREYVRDNATAFEQASASPSDR